MDKFVGIENRDYVRNDNRGQPGGTLGAECPAVRTIILITVGVFLAQMFITRPPNNAEIQRLYPQFDESVLIGDQFGNHPNVSVPEQWLQLDTDKVLGQGQVWRLITSAFCHDRFGVWHILINMLLLFWFGRELETIYGSRAFAWFYVTAAIFSALAFIGLQLITEERQPAIGASGAVMAVMMIYAIFHPRDEIYLFFIIPVQIRFLLLFYLIYDLHPVLLTLAGTPVQTGIAHAAHLGGLLYGYLFWKTGHSLLTLWDKTPMARSRRVSGKRQSGVEPRIIPIKGPFAKEAKKKPTKDRRRERLDQEVDRILAKISESGRGSLTDKEIATLETASRKYNERSDD